MQNPIQKFRQSSIVFEKRDILSENLKTLTSSNYIPYSSIVFAETLLTFPTYQCLQNYVRDFFYFVQISSFLQKVKRPGFYTLVFTFLLITQNLNKIKKYRTSFVDIMK